MKNLSAYLDDFINQEDGNYFEGCKGKISCGKIGEKDFMKANRRASRNEEIEAHGKLVKFGGLHKSKKTYTRKDKYRKTAYD
mgnify:CR=1 FL=1